MRSDQVTERRSKVQVWVYWVPHSPQLQAHIGVRFLVLRTLPERGGFWQPVTGGVESGEIPEVAALREALEETGLAPGRPIFKIGEPFEFESRWGLAVEFPFGFEVNEPRDQPPAIQLDLREHDQFAWVSAEEALRRVKFASNKKNLVDLIQKLENKKENTG